MPAAPSSRVGIVVTIVAIIIVAVIAITAVTLVPTVVVIIASVGMEAFVPLELWSLLGCESLRLHGTLLR